MKSGQNGQWLTRIVRMSTGMVFLLSGLLKCEDTGAFIDSIRSFDLLPEIAVPYFAFCIIFSEVVFGVLLVIGSRTKEVTAVLCVMMLIFTAAVVTAFAAGGDQTCGCFGDRYTAAVNEWTIVRNIGLMILLVWLNRTAVDVNSIRPI